MINFLNKRFIAGLCFGIGLTFNVLSYANPINFVPEVHAQLSSNNKSSAEWTKGEDNDIQAIGIGLPPVGSNHIRGKVLARRAAIVDAQRNLLEYINGVSLDADTTVNQLAVDSDVVRTQVSGIVRNAKVVSEKYTADGSYEIVLSVPMYGEKKSLASVVIPKMVEKLPSQNPTYVDEIKDNGEITGSFTGVIVDAKGFALDATFAPAIYDTEGRIVYGLQKVDHSYAINHGLVQYATKIDGNNRAGSNPLLIKAIGIRGGKNSVNNVNVIVSKEDADKIVMANKKNNFIENCAVVFVR